MARPNKAGTAQAKAWTENARIETSGPTAEVIKSLFAVSGDYNKRQAILEELNKLHDSISAEERQREWEKKHG